MLYLTRLLPVKPSLLFRRFVLFICIWLASVVFLMAQPGSKQYQFRRIDISKGLSHNQVTTILKDSRGFMWFGTISGLNRYDGHAFKIFKHDAKDSASISDDYINRIRELPDGKLLVDTRNWMSIYNPSTEKFEHNIQAYFSGLGLPDTTLLSLAKTRQGMFYFLFARHGLYQYNPVTKQSVKINLPGNMDVTAMSQNGRGDLWLIYRNGIIEKLDVQTNRIVYRTQAVADYRHQNLFNYTLLADNEDELWIFTPSDPMGTLYYRPVQKQLLPCNVDEGPYRLNTNIVVGMLQDNQGKIWVCTDHGGVNLIDKKAGTIRYLTNSADDNTSLSQNSITSFYKDDQGIIWIGTFKKGLNCFGESIIQFPLYRHQPSNPGSLGFDDVNRFTEDAKGNLWIGTNGGGLIYFDRAAGTFTTYRHQPGNAASLTNDIIVSLLIDKKGKLWIGTYFGGLDCYDGKTFTHYRHNPADNTTIADDRVWEIFEDQDDNLWIGTLAGGLDRMDRANNIFHHYTSSQYNSVRSNYISAITQNKAGDIWIGTSQGFDVLEKSSGRFVHYGHSASDAGSLSNGNVVSILIDSYGRHWVGTREGLNLFNKATQHFQHFTIKEGLPDNAILNILEDDKHNLWISTPKGISNLSVSAPAPGGSAVQINCKNYDETDGLQGIEFNENAALKTGKGELVFGGPNGFNLFLPQAISSVKQTPKIAFTDFQLFNNSIAPGEEVAGEVLLPQSISETRSLTLNHNQNVIAIEFTALNYSNAKKIKYAYQLEGFKDEWLMADDRLRKAIFTNLDPGNYVFKVRTANDDGSWNNNDTQLQIIIRPPFWKSPAAYLLYFLIIAAALYIGRIIIIRNAKQRFAIEQERKEAHRMHELDLMKIRFFTNVSHEFRTPLSLIITPVEKLVKEGGGDKKQFGLILRNARRLLNLVNQLLDFRKLEEQELHLNKTSGDIIGFIKESAYSFSDIAENKHITFSFVTAENLLFTTFDQDKLERILFNLLSNAFKFTPVGGTVQVSVETGKEDGERMLRIKVADSGIGIAKDKQEKIFERFFQNEIPGTMVNQGSGIGLSITKEFVRLHGGTIAVESEAGNGSCFTVMLPIAHVPMETIEILKPEAMAETPASTPATPSPLSVEADNNQSIKGKKKSILLVEDNDDFRFYIKDNLKAYYTIIEAADGKSGWQKALSEHPDLVVTDISMPEMNGIDLCKKIKADARTSFIPVILLTALTGEEQQLAGLQTGASDYITKPFNFEILLSKVKNLLLQQESFKKTYQKQVQAHSTEPVTESAEEKFIRQALAVVEKNISNPDFSVEEMSREMFMSRVALYKKLFNLTGKTPIEFIRSIRLERAAQLLKKRELTVAEVAYEVGFNNPKNFSRYFKTEYNVLPSAYAGSEETE